MKYPDPEKVHIWICDDNRRPEMRELAREMGVGYFDRPDNKGAKAGNLNCAMARTSAPYIVTFDADMIPKSDFLLKTTATVVLKGVITGTRESRNRRESTQTIEILDDCGNRYEYLAILYDRIPTLPQTLSRDLGIFRYLWRNVAMRLARTGKD